VTGLLLYTHTMIWWSSGEAYLPKSARAVIASSEGSVFVSAVSVYEADYKSRRGRIPLMPVPALEAIEAEGFIELAITFEDAALAARLDHAHGDPFDRFLAAQAILRDLTVVTRDPAIAALGAPTFW
jgi:PIN domain nuclease of toxin-antitoxin system